MSRLRNDVLRLFVGVLLLLSLAMTSSHAAQPGPVAKEVPPESPDYAAIVTSLEHVLAGELAQPVRLETSSVRLGGDFAFVAAKVVQPDGNAIDFRKTVYLDAITSGLFDGPYLWALLGQTDGHWSVLEHDIGPTDAYFVSWPSIHGADCTLVGDSIETC